MEKKPTRWQRLLAGAEEVLDERAGHLGLQFTRLQKFAHFWVLVGRSFVRNRCPVRASALAYGTLLALVPMLAIVVSVTSTFLKKEGEDRIDEFVVRMVSSLTPPAVMSTNELGTAAQEELEDFWMDLEPEASPAANATTNAASATGTNAPGLPSFARAQDAVQARKAVSRNINHFIQNTRSGTLGVTGSVLLIFVAISMLSRIESTFNDIWGVGRGRTWFMRIVLYWGVITLVPLLLVVAIALASGPFLEGPKRLIASMPFFGQLLFQLLPVVVLCLTFSVFYALMPNTKVRWTAALAGGVVGGVLFHLNNVSSVLYVSRVVSNSKIYGSLGMVPVFMIGLYFAWVILLFGAQVAYAFQNRATYFEEKQVENINQRGREFISLRLMTLVGQRFLHGEPPPTAGELSERIGVPTRLIRQIMQTLGSARLVVETSGAECAFLPSRPIENITCHDILQAMRATQGNELATREEPTRAEVYGEFNRIQEAERQAASSVTLLDLASRAQRQLTSGSSI